MYWYNIVKLVKFDICFLFQACILRDSYNLNDFDFDFNTFVLISCNLVKHCLSLKEDGCFVFRIYEPCCTVMGFVC